MVTDRRFGTASEQQANVNQEATEKTAQMEFT